MTRSRRKGGATTTREIEIRERQAQALELRKAGASYEKIAERLGYKNPSGAYGAVQRALHEMVAEPTEELRRVHYERLNHMLVVLWPRVQKGELAAMDRAVGVMDRIAKLYGIDMPAITTSLESREVIIIDGTRDDYIASLKAMKAGRVTVAENFKGPASSDGSPGGPHANLVEMSGTPLPDEIEEVEGEIGESPQDIEEAEWEEE